MDVRRLMDGRSNKRRQRNNGFAVADTDTENEDAELDVMGSDSAGVNLPNAATPEQVLVVDMSTGLAAPGKSTQSTVVGGALRRNSDGTSMAPRIVKRKKIGQKVGRSIIYSPCSRYISLGKPSTVVKAIYAAGSQARV